MYAEGTGGKYPLVSGEGGKEPLLGDLAEFSMGSDHELYEEASWKIPAIYLNDWPDRYIHTNFDIPANIDPTKLQRAAFIGAASALFLANLKSTDVPALWAAMESSSLRRLATMLDRRATLPTRGWRGAHAHLSLAGARGVRVDRDVRGDSRQRDAERRRVLSATRADHRCAAATGAARAVTARSSTRAMRP